MVINSGKVNSVHVSNNGKCNIFRLENGNEVLIQWFSFKGKDTTSLFVTKRESTDSNNCEEYRVVLEKGWKVNDWTLKVGIRRTGRQRSYHYEELAIDQQQGLKPKKTLLPKYYSPSYLQNEGVTTESILYPEATVIAAKKHLKTLALLHGITKVVYLDALKRVTEMDSSLVTVQSI